MKKVSSLLVVILLIFISLSIYSIDKVINSITIQNYSQRPTYYSFIINGTDYVYVAFPGEHCVKLEFNNSTISYAYAIVIFYPSGINIVLSKNVITLTSQNSTAYIRLHPGLYKVVYFISGYSSKPIQQNCISKYISIKIS
ncbi:hypothetical protein [Acidianus ambivalens]|uniref:Uncharacterized protein n=1 Tax=Acidianus ambivalens TaxID=2283 RepID=A0A650CW18_ACIAM|nr:hypothetical protein [Acidianus ambivalens]MQL55792.1 hypothetical protein [Acidianus ambivalens]QGR21637.1 hypothetical protein D1866_06235 [Acidianus ambivalens]